MLTYFTTEEIEQISLEKLSSMIRKAGKRKIGSQLDKNDKGPSWDGFLFLYNEEKTTDKEKISSRIPVQVKGTEVKKLSNKFNSFPIEISDLKNYFNDGGVIFIVVEVKGDSNEESRIFYKLLLPRDLQLILDEVEQKGNKKSKNVRIDNILNEKINFYDECKKFEIEKQHQSIAQVRRSLPLDKLTTKRLEFVSIKNPLEVLRGNVYPYVRDEYNQLIPVRDVIQVYQIRVKINQELIIKGKKYFDSFYEIHDRDEKISYSFGDNIIIDMESIHIKQSEGNILERLNTLNFIFDNINLKTIKDNTNEMKKLNMLKSEKECIDKIIRVCEKFNIAKDEIKIANLSEQDYYYLDILDSTKNSSKCIQKVDKYELRSIEFSNNNIVLLKITYDEIEEFYNYYASEFDMELSYKINNDIIMMSRFLILEKEALLCKNFDKQVVTNSFTDINENYKSNICNDYNLFMLELIKAWDKSRDIEYIDLANYIINLIKNDFDNEEILKINKAQIEYRINGILSAKTRDDLYKIKFDTDSNENKVAIAILLEDYESFTEYFGALSEDSKEKFESFPIYYLYENNKDNKGREH